MKNVKYRLESLSPFDLRGTEEHLAAMAAQGWRLEDIRGWFWRYRRAEPAAVRYAVACPPAAGEDGCLGDRQFFEDLCASAGWKAVCDWAELQIYVNEAPDPVPLETDETLRLESIHRSMKRTYLRERRSELFCDLLLLILWCSNLLTHPHTYLLSGAALTLLPVCLLMALVSGLSIAWYFSWRRRSLRSVEEGGGLAAVPRSYRVLSRLPAVFLVLLFLALVLLKFRTGDARDASVLLIGFAAAFLAAALTGGMNGFLRERGWEGFSRAAAVILALLALLALLSGLADGLDLSERIRSSQTEAASYVWNDENWDLEPQPLPLTLEDLTGMDWPHVRRTARSQGRTPFASEMGYTETAAGEDGAKLNLHYVLTDVPNDRLRRVIFDDIRNGPSFLEYRSEDPGLWQAEAAYRLYYPDGRAVGEWLILWPGRVAALCAEGLDLGPEEMAVITEHLAPEAP